MKLYLNKKLFTESKITILTLSSLILLIVLLVFGCLLGLKMYTFLFGALPQPADKPNLAYAIKSFVELLFVIVPSLVGVFVGGLITIIVAKSILNIPRDVFETWLDSTNDCLGILRKWNAKILDKFYKT